jgi:hypothetical protein
MRYDYYRVGFDLDEWTLTIGRLTSKIQKLDVNRPIVNVHRTGNFGR